jgi:hypothetical protein
MSKQKLVRFKNNELHTLFQLCKTSHPDIARKIKGYMGVKAVKLDKIESHRLSMQSNIERLHAADRAFIDAMNKPRSDQCMADLPIYDKHAIMRGLEKLLLGPASSVA